MRWREQRWEWHGLWIDGLVIDSLTHLFSLSKSISGFCILPPYLTLTGINFRSLSSFDSLSLCGVFSISSTVGDYFNFYFVLRKQSYKEIFSHSCIASIYPDSNAIIHGYFVCFHSRLNLLNTLSVFSGCKIHLFCSHLLTQWTPIAHLLSDSGVRSVGYLSIENAQSRLGIFGCFVLPRSSLHSAVLEYQFTSPKWTILVLRSERDRKTHPWRSRTGILNAPSRTDLLTEFIKQPMSVCPWHTDH